MNWEQELKINWGPPGHHTNHMTWIKFLRALKKLDLETK